MNYMIEVFYSNSATVERYNAINITQANAIVAREVSKRFVRKVELYLLLETFAPRR